MSVLDHPSPSPASGSGRSPENRLDSWKAIAAYLGRGVRTVQRWEREEGLPVHRLAHEKRGSVYADRQEVDAWWESRRRTLSNGTSVDAPETPASPTLERVTRMSAATFWPALSSDGRLLAYVSDGGRDGTSPRIWLHQIGGSAVCLTGGSCERSHVAFSADDTRLGFTATDDSGQNVYAMPTLGGEPRLLERGARAGRPSPDGRWLAYIALDQPSGVRLAALDGTSDRTIGPDLIDVAFASTHPDQNLWSVAIDPVSGMSHGSLRRLTRGPGMVSQLSVSRDARTLAYFFGRPTDVGLMLRSLDTGSEAEFAPEPRMDCGFPAISPGGWQLAYGVRSQGPRVMRPIFVATLPDGTSRKLGDDCGGRPRQWVDERFLIVERFGGRLHSVGLLDTVSGDQHDLLSSPEQSLTNARVSADGRWIAFDAARPGGPSTVFVARLRRELISPDSWVTVDRPASHPFWSADGSLLYYLATTPSSELRNVVRARRFDPAAGVPLGDPVAAFTSTEMVVPTMITGTAPVATRDQIIFVLGDFRGDVRMIDATSSTREP